VFKINAAVQYHSTTPHHYIILALLAIVPNYMVNRFQKRFLKINIWREA
jgi:hypothetical protein